MAVLLGSPTLEHQGLTARLGERVGEAVAEVEPGHVAAPTEAAEGGAGERRVLARNGVQLANDLSVAGSLILSAIATSISTVEPAYGRVGRLSIDPGFSHPLPASFPARDALEPPRP